MTKHGRLWLDNLCTCNITIFLQLTTRNERQQGPHLSMGYAVEISKTSYILEVYTLHILHSILHCTHPFNCCC